jgi:GNAT superfamily N-acetyltransferase
VQLPGQSHADGDASEAILIRAIDPRSAAEVDLVASGMRRALVEVEGENTGNALYTMDWLKDRVRWHLDSEKSWGEVFVAENGAGSITGHTIVRVEHDAAGRRYGLFAATFVEPGSRRQAIATCLLDRGEKWMIERALLKAATRTPASNSKLISLYVKHGYAIVERHVHNVTKTPMVKLAKALAPMCQTKA